MEISVNRTDVLTPIHPCFEIDISKALIRNLSEMCMLFHIVLGSLSVITVCGNLLVITSVIYFKQLHTPSNFLVLSLAVADMFVGVLVFPLTMEFSFSSCLFNDGLFCKVRGTFDVSLCSSSILNLCCISIDRYYAVCQPLTYRTKINDYVVVFMILVSWGVSVIIGISFVIVGIHRENCAENCFLDGILAHIMGLIFSFYLPVIIMLFIYLKIFLVAQRQARSIHNTTKCGAAVSKMERKATKTLAIVMGVFLMCWLPFFLCSTVLSFTRVYVPLSVIELLNWLALSNSLLNPFIYAFFYTWFRSAFRMIITGKIIRGEFSNTTLN